MTAVSDWMRRLEAALGPWTAPALVLLFVLSSMLIIWRLEKMMERGIEGTVLGTLFMPYMSGLGNLVFVGSVLRRNGPADEVVVNASVNNLTNLCLLLPLPAIIWGLNLRPVGKAKKVVAKAKVERLSLQLSLLAAGFFTAVTWLLMQDGRIDRFDGFALVGLFLFWQAFHVFEVLKDGARSGSSMSPWIAVDSALILAGSCITLFSVDGIVAMILAREDGFFSRAQLGLLTGWLMVLPNALLAFYYAARKRADVAYSSQVGDAHICIPLAIGLFAVFEPIRTSESFDFALGLLAAAAVIHFAAIQLFKGMPRLLAGALIVAYGAILVGQL